MKRHLSRHRARQLARQLFLGTGPLKRTTDRLHGLSRLLVVLALLAALPFGIGVGRSVASALHRSADAQAATLAVRTATLLADAPPMADPEADGVYATATWSAPDGRPVTGRVVAPPGAHAGSTVTVWLDRNGRIASPPQAGQDITVEGITAGLLAALALPLVAGFAHLLAVTLLDRARYRRWTAEWLSVEPLWAGRAR